MTLPALRYLAAPDLDEACRVLSRHRGRARILAGGQSLVGQLAVRACRPELLVDVSRLEALRHVQASNGCLVVGAGVRQRELEQHPAARRVPGLRDVLGLIGHVPTRNRGTIGGSIAFADPSAELPALLVSFAGSVRARSLQGEREIPARQLYAGPFATVLRDDEVLTEIRLPADSGHRLVIRQLSWRRHAKVTVIARHTSADQVEVTVGGVAGRPVVAVAGLRVVGEADTRGGDVQAAAEAVGDLIEPSNDLHAPASYRRRLALEATRLALDDLVNRERGG